MTETINQPTLDVRTAITKTRHRKVPSAGVLLALVLTGQFMAVLDNTVVNVAAPALRTDLNATGASMQLVLAGYTVAYAVLLVTGARLGDRLGAQRMFRTGLGVFTAASLACALAPTAGSLIAFRVVQGGGAAVMVPQVLSIIQRSLTGDARSRALGRYATVIAGGAVAGQVLGGLLVAADLFGTGWRPVFAINVPIGVVLLAVGVRVLPREAGDRNRGLDLPGLLTLAATVLALVVPLVLGPEQGWPVLCWLALAAVPVLFGGFLVTQRRARSPLFPGQVLGAPGLVPAAIALFLAMSTYGAFLLVGSVHLQSGLGWSALRCGLLFAPSAVGFGLSSMYWSRLPRRLLRWITPAGLLLAGLGYLGIGYLIGSGRPGSIAMYAVMLACGLGFGVVMSPLLATALTHVPQRLAADASGLLVTLVQLAIVTGVATFGTVYLALVRQHPAGRTAVLQSAHAASLASVALGVTTLLAGVVTVYLARLRSVQ
jgi:MFS family permease